MISIPYDMIMTIFRCMISSVQKLNPVEKNIIPHDTCNFEQNHSLTDEKEPWKLNWVPPKHLRLEKYYYGDENV